jgi:hypothetical protein
LTQYISDLTGPSGGAGLDRAVGPNGAGEATAHLVARAPDTGAASGVLTDGGAALAAVLVTVFGPPLSGWQTKLLAQPAG